MYTPFPLNERGLMSKWGGVKWNSCVNFNFIYAVNVYTQKSNEVIIHILTLSLFFLIIFSIHIVLLLTIIHYNSRGVWTPPFPLPDPPMQVIWVIFFLQIARLWVDLVFFKVSSWIKFDPPPPGAAYRPAIIQCIHLN